MTIAQQLKINKFPFTIRDDDGRKIYREEDDGYFEKWVYDYRDNNKEIGYEDSDGYRQKWVYVDDYEVYYENSDGYWRKNEHDSYGNTVYHEDSDGQITDYRPKPIVEMTLEEIADKIGISVEQLRIKE